jgi:hypothetical protein
MLELRAIIAENRNPDRDPTKRTWRLTVIGDNRPPCYIANLSADLEAWRFGRVSAAASDAGAAPCAICGGVDFPDHHSRTMTQRSFLRRLLGRVFG